MQGESATRLSLAIACATTMLAAGAAAQTTGTIVTAPLRVEERHVPEAYRLEETAPVVRIDREQFDKLPSDRASDVLGRMPGVVIGGPPGEKKSINLRGLPGDFTRVQIDGLQPAARTRTFELMDLSSFLLGEAAIVRNPTAEYEADGIAGRIAIKTREIPTQPEGELRGAFGGLDSLDGTNRQLGAGYGRRIGNLGLLGHVSYDRRLITKEKPFSERTFAGGPGGAGFLRDEAEPKIFENIDMALDLAGFYQGGEVHLKPVALIEETDIDKQRDQFRRVTGQRVDTTLTKGEESLRTTGVTLEHVHRFDGALELRSHVSWSEADSATDNRETTFNANGAFAGASRSTSDYLDRIVQVGSSLTVPLATPLPQKLKGGVAFRQGDRDSDGTAFTVNATGLQSQTPANLLTSTQADYEIGESYYAGFLQDELRIGRLSLTPGLRVEHVSYDLRGFNGSFSPSFTDLFPSLPAALRLTDDMTLRAAVSRQVNRPKYDDIAPGMTVRGPRTIIGDPNLKPARAWSFDAGGDHVTPNLFLGLNLFHREITDLIELSEGPINTFRARNVGDGWVQGIELEQRLGLGLLGWKALQPLTLFANQTLLRSEVNDPDTGPRRFAEQPRLVANAGLTWADPDWGTTFTAVANYTAERPTLSNEGAGQLRDKRRAAEVFLDLYAEQRVAQGVGIYFTVENLTNQAREEVEVLGATLDRDASIAVGRTFFLGAKARF